MTFTPRRMLAVGAATAAVALGLAACSSGSNADTLDMDSDAPTGVTLTLWNTSGDTQALLDLYQAYEDASGNTIELVTLPNDTYTNAVQTKWATGERPDILEYHANPQDMAQLNVSENMIDLSSLSFVSAEGSLATQAGSIDGKTYAAILGPLSAFGVFYNADAFAAAGLDAPTSYEDVLSECSTLAAAGTDPVYVAGGSEFPIQMLTAFTYLADANVDGDYAASLADGSAKAGDDGSPMVSGLDLLTQLQDQGCLNDDATTATFDQAISAVLSGDAAMTVLPSDFISQFYAADPNADQSVSFGAISASDGLGSYAPGPQGTYFVPDTGDSTKERAAADFIEWVTTEGYQDYVDAGQVVPTLSTATAPEFTGLYAQAADLLAADDKSPSVNMTVPGWGNYSKVAMKVLAGQSTAQEAADEFQTYIDQARAAAE
ncbi:MAG: ABC transporter substrate-binding protein [Microbacterium sp.]|uniref:ABC transporter substrate-binding protein n=1 Tax=Microbacterium sp. TaxID=51671 RepID=UPI0039E2807C